ncbi:MAG: hypothetical protein EZS28_048686, partial [Streblomastix strix]
MPLTPGRVQLPNHEVWNLEHNKKPRDFIMRGYFRRTGLEMKARSKGFDNLSYNPFANFQPNFNPNQYIDNLSQIPSQDQQEYSNDIDQYQMQRDDDHDSNDDVFGEPDLIELQVRGRRGRGKKKLLLRV